MLSVQLSASTVMLAGARVCRCSDRIVVAIERSSLWAGTTTWTDADGIRPGASPAHSLSVTVFGPTVRGMH